MRGTCSYQFYINRKTNININTNKQTERQKKSQEDKNEHFPHKMGQGPMPTILPITR
jgi:hypothetical protein